MLSLNNYGSSSSSDDEDDDASSKAQIEENLHLKNIKCNSTITKGEIVAAPVVEVHLEADARRRYIDTGSVKELQYNPKFEELYSPDVGPFNPFKTEQESAIKNNFAGYVEGAHVNEFHFELQRKTFHSYGYAVDPSISVSSSDPGGGSLISNSTEAETSSFKSVFDEPATKRPGDKRKKMRNNDPSDVEGYLGPWGSFVDQQHTSQPTEEDAAYLEAYLSKMKRKNKKQEEKPAEESSTMHLKEAIDYQGRNFLHAPHDVGINLRSDEPPHKCFIPKRQIHTWKGHTKGVSAISWFPKTAHLLLSAGLDSNVKVWRVYGDRSCVRTYSGHRQAVKDICWNNSGEKFLTTSFDRYAKLWDTETGNCIGRFTTKKIGHCVRFNPDGGKQNLFVVGTADKKIVCWDTRSEQIVQEYDRHLGAVNSITFVDNNRRFISTSDDKSLRVWEWDIPVDMKYIADPSMHSMPFVRKAPNDKWLACQSLDNKICIFTCHDKYKLNRKKEFKGHMVAGYACGIDFSPEMSYLVSGDGDGRVYIWNWKTSLLVSKWKAHDKVCVGVLWHPHETSKVATAGWDGVIKYWD